MITVFFDVAPWSQNISCKVPVILSTISWVSVNFLAFASYWSFTNIILNVPVGMIPIIWMRVSSQSSWAHKVWGSIIQAGWPYTANKLLPLIRRALTYAPTFFDTVVVNYSFVIVRQLASWGLIPHKSVVMLIFGSLVSSITAIVLCFPNKRSLRYFIWS
jgi:hypothetical protein